MQGQSCTAGAEESIVNPKFLATKPGQWTESEKEHRTQTDSLHGAQG